MDEERASENTLLLERKEMQNRNGSALFIRRLVVSWKCCLRLERSETRNEDSRC